MEFSLLCEWYVLIIQHMFLHANIYRIKNTNMFLARVMESRAEYLLYCGDSSSTCKN